MLQGFEFIDVYFEAMRSLHLLLYLLLDAGCADLVDVVDGKAEQRQATKIFEGAAETGLGLTCDVAEGVDDAANKSNSAEAGSSTGVLQTSENEGLEETNDRW